MEVAAVETAKLEGIERINSIEANYLLHLIFRNLQGEVNGENQLRHLKKNKVEKQEPSTSIVVLSDDTTREPEVVTSNSSQPQFHQRIMYRNKMILKVMPHYQIRVPKKIVLPVH